VLPTKQHDTEVFNTWSVRGKTARASAKDNLMFGLSATLEGIHWRKTLSSVLPCHGNEDRLLATHPCMHVGLGMIRIFQGCQLENNATVQPPQWS